MLNNNSKGRHDLSQRLKDSEAPHSPRELDERIIQRAREKAEEYADNSNPAGIKWPGAGWKPVVAVFSVAVIAVMVTFQYNDNSRFAQVALKPASQEAEVAALQPGDSPLTVTTDSQSRPTQPAREQEFLPTQEIENRGQTLASPSAASTGVTAGRTVRLEQSQLSAQADSAARAGITVNPSLTELLSNIDSPAATAQADQTAALADSIDQLAGVLNVIENSLIDSGIDMEADSQPGLSPTIEQLAARAGSLLKTYDAIENDELRERLQAVYLQQRQAYSIVDLPPSIEIMTGILQNWLSNR